MHYTVKFEGSAAQKQTSAITETKQWMGAKHFRVFTENFRALTVADSHATRMRRLHFWLGFNGVTGRAVVHAVYRYVATLK